MAPAVTIAVTPQPMATHEGSSGVRGSLYVLQMTALSKSHPKRGSTPYLEADRATGP
jgi:hypothetical protein